MMNHHFKKAVGLNAFLPAVLILVCLILPLSGALAEENPGLKIQTRESAPSDLAMALYRQALSNWQDFEKEKAPRQYAAALFHIESAIEMDDTKAEYFFVRAMILSRMTADPGAVSAAVSSLIQAVTLEPMLGRARLLLAQLLFEQKKFDLALIQFTHLMDHDPVNMSAAVITVPAALCYAALDRADQGAHYFEQLVNQVPESTAAMFSLAVLYEKTGQAEAARKVAARIAAHPKATEASRQHARNLLKQWGDKS